jgi:nicotinate-nucleotide adenylyltransferase
VSRRRRIGVFGGTFDPVHFGHLLMAAETLGRLRLDSLLFVPARRPAHKRSRALAPVEDRIAMLRIATRQAPRFQVSDIEANGDQVNFTVRTLEALLKRERAEYFFLMGQDSLEEFTAWREPERILSIARLVVVPRGDAELPLLPSAVRRRVVFLRPPRIGISSTEIRRRLRRGISVRYWLPDAVLAYAARHGLYGIRARRR